MGITEKALKANGRSRACGKCPLGLANCNETIAKVCRDAFLEGFKNGYEQKNREVKEQIDGILHPVSEPCGDNEIYVFFRDVRSGENQPGIKNIRLTDADDFQGIGSIRFSPDKGQPQQLQIAWCYPKDLMELLGYDKKYNKYEAISLYEGHFSYPSSKYRENLEKYKEEREKYSQYYNYHELKNDEEE